MLVTSVWAQELRTSPDLSTNAEAVELRLDGSDLTPDDVTRLVESLTIPVLATHHGAGGDDLLCAAIDAGARWVDVDCDQPRPAVIATARSRGCQLVISHHDYAGTPAAQTLHAIVARAWKRDADIVKIACHVNSPSDNARLIALLDDPRPTVAIGMGLAGALTRVAGFLCGSPLVFVAPEATQATEPTQGTTPRTVRQTAPGQLTTRELHQAANYLAGLK